MMLEETHSSGGGLVKDRAMVTQAQPCVTWRFGQAALGMAASPQLPPAASSRRGVPLHSLTGPSKQC